jgi:Co/Zn/Cd efflux system component
MIDYPLQFVASAAFIVLIVSHMWRTRRSRLLHRPAGWRRFGRLLARLVLVLLILVALLLAVDATRFGTAHVCIEFRAGSEWCLHDETAHDAQTHE